jgi:secretion/DNA translocation related TadE-like protein
VSQHHDDRGSATVLVVAMAGVLVLLGAALSVVTAMVAAHRAAQSAADLAALAGARDVAAGRDGCARAAQVASANRARLTACSVSWRVVGVQVEVDGPHWLGQTADLSGRARAGPAGPAP